MLPMMSEIPGGWNLLLRADLEAWTALYFVAKPTFGWLERNVRISCWISLSVTL